MLKLVGTQSPKIVPIAVDIEAEANHRHLLDRFYQSHRIRGHAESTITSYRQYLEAWFLEHGNGERSLYSWEAMEPVAGRELIRNYSKNLVDVGLLGKTIRSYLLLLKQYFTFILDHPYVTSGRTHRRIEEVYGPIAQPIGEFDLPVNSGEAEVALPLEPEKLYDFLSLLRNEYLKGHHLRRTQIAYERNYAMAVVAAESGLRADELVHLHVNDLFFDSLRIQTRFAKGKRGSGKRSRTTLFGPLARDSMRYYLDNCRGEFLNADRSPLLFLSNKGKMISSTTLSRIVGSFLKCAHTHHFPIHDHMSWHWFRRLFATRFIEKFPNKMPLLLELLGHSNMATVHRYIKHSEAWLDKEIQSVLEGSSQCPFTGD